MSEKNYHNIELMREQQIDDRWAESAVTVGAELDRESGVLEERLIRAESQLSAIRVALERCKAAEGADCWDAYRELMKDIEAILGGER